MDPDNAFIGVQFEIPTDDLQSEWHGILCIRKSTHVLFYQSPATRTLQADGHVEIRQHMQRACKKN